MKRLFFLLSCFFIFSFHVNGANYYWIGGTGNWDDLNHWATSSGGTVLHNQIPTATDDIFFDAGSGFIAGNKTVTIDVATAFCHTMDWTGAANNPVLDGSSSTIIKIYGSLKFIAAMNIPYQGNVYFSSTTAGNTITMAGQVYQYPVWFEGTGGWILQDAFNALNSIEFMNGSLNTNNQTVTAYTFSSEVTSTRSLTLGSSVFNLKYWYVNHTNLSFSCGTSTLNIFFNFLADDLATENYYDVNFNNPASAVGQGISAHTGTIQFHNVIFTGSARVFGTNAFNILSLAAGKTYVLESAKTQTINSALNAVGNCNATITIASFMAGSQSTISKSSSSVTVDYVSLKDIKATGGAAFTANNAVDLGNNTGWTINTVSPQNLYWVGGSGNWGDQSHWSTSSGGTGGACLPTAYNNVFFDAGSGFIAGSKTVTIDVPTAFCHSMDWTGAANNPVLDGDNSTIIKIYGSLKFIAAMSIPYQGNVYFSSTTAGNTITMAGQVYQYPVWFEGTGGWILQDAFNALNSIEFMNGSLNTNNQTVTAYTFSSEVTSTRSLILGSSVFNLKYWYVNHTNLSFSCGTSTLNIFFNFLADDLTTANYYDVNFNNPASAVGQGISTHSGTLQFHNVTFAGSGRIFGTNGFNVLSLAAGKTYQLESAKTQTINSALNAAGNCNAIITIASYTAGLQSIISKSSNSVTVDYVSLKDIKATGGAAFTANNAVDLGNNSGWTINTVSPQNLYWVGGSGNWGDQSHWSTSSGGTGGACLPTAYNDVFFDAGSGFIVGSKTVTIDVATAFCHSMDWTGAASNPFLDGDNSTIIKIYGSLKFIAAMSFPYQGNVYFSSTTAGNTITMAGQVYQFPVWFEGSGSWILQDAFNALNSVEFMSGSLNTNNQTVTAYTFSSQVYSTRSLTLGSSVFNLKYWYVNHTNLNFSCGTSTLNIFFNFLADDLATANYYDVNFNNPASTVGQGISAHTGTIQFRNVSFAGSGRVYGNNTFNTLVMAAGSSYGLQSALTQTIQNRWDVQGSCVSYILLKSSITGNFATVNKASGAVMGFNIHMQDIHAVGGATFNAFNSTDLGGNTGWNFAALPPLANVGTITGITAVCAGQNGIVYHVSPTPGAISYTWTVPPGATITSMQGDTIIVVDFTGASSGNVSVTASSGCATSATNTLPVTVNSSFVPVVSIATGSTTICAGTSVTFTATPTNGGPAPVYQWQVNGINVGTNAVTYTSTTLLNGDNVTVILNSSLSCASPASATSNTITMNVQSPATPSVSIAASPSGPVCAGTAVIFTATPVNTNGGTVTYDFKVNGSSVQNSPSNTYTSSTLTTGNTVRCDITISGAACLTAPSAISNTISMQVNVAVTPTVTISISQPLPVCIGTWVTFTATAANTGGGSINYDFKVNGSSVQSGAFNVYSMPSFAGDMVTCEVTISGGSCLTASTAVSYTITMAVNNPVTPAVNIIANPGTNTCAGTMVMIGAAASNTGGGGVNYNFKVNGVTVQNGPATFFWLSTNTITTGSTVECEITINGGTCLTSSTAQSNILTMTVNNPVTPTVNLTPSPGNTICAGTLVTFTAVTSNTAGGTIINHAFKVNGTTVQNGTSNTFSTATLTNGDIVSCVTTIILGTCLTNTTPLSNNIIMAVNPAVTASVSITANTTTICSGMPVTFTTSPVNGGINPIYQWKVNGINAGSNLPTFTSSTLANADIVTVSMASAASCAAPALAISNAITVVVTAAQPASLVVSAPSTTICAGAPVNFTATSFNTTSITSWQWKLNGINTGTNSMLYSNDQLKQGDVISCVLTANTVCGGVQQVNSNTLVMTVNPVPVIGFDPPNPSIFAGSAVQLKAIVPGNISSYLWSPATGLSNTAIANPVARPVITTIYNLHVITTENCFADKMITVLVSPGEIYIPNSFTPDGNGTNDFFRIPPGTALVLQSFLIYNRYGNEVFRTNNISQGWDGRFKGTPSPGGTYTYIIKGTSRNMPVLLQGTVILIR